MSITCKTATELSKMRPQLDDILNYEISDGKRDLVSAELATSTKC